MPSVDRFWAQCTACGKWRALPSAMRADPSLDEAWTCDQSPDPDRRGCAAPEEECVHGEVTEAVETSVCTLKISLCTLKISICTLKISLCTLEISPRGK